MGFTLSALRAILELLLFSLAGQGVLALIAGSGKDRNPIYQLFSLLTRPVLAGISRLFPRLGSTRIGAMSFAILLGGWLFLGWMKFWI